MLAAHCAEAAARMERSHLTTALVGDHPAELDALVRRLRRAA